MTYINSIKKIIREVKSQYVCPIYNLENLDNIRNDEIQFIIDDQLFLDILLAEIRGKSISYSAYKKKKLNEREKKLEKDIVSLEQNLTEDSLNSLSDKQDELLNIGKNRLKGHCIRSKSKWIDEGEKPTRYFINLETRNFINKQIPNIEKEDGSFILDQTEILKETKTFYEKLYKKREIIDKYSLYDKLKTINSLNLTMKN